MKTFLKILVALLGLVLAIWLVLQFIVRPHIKNSLEQNLAHYPQDTVHIEKLSLSFFPLGVSMSDAQFSLHVPADSLMVLWEGKIESAAAGDVNWWQALVHNNWRVGSVKVKGGDLHWVVDKRENPRYSKKEKSEKQTGKDKSKKSFLLWDVSLTDMDFHLKRDSFEVALLTNLKIDSLALMTDAGAKWQAHRILIDSKEALVENAVKDYNLGYSHLHYDSQDSVLLIKGFKVAPRLGREELDKKYNFRSLQTNLKVKSIRLNGLDWDRLKTGLFARSLVIDSADVEFYSNSTKPVKKEIKPLPSEAILKLPFKVEVDTVQLKASRLMYQEKATKTGKLAELRADRGNLKLYPFSNLNDSLSADFTMDGSIRFMENAKLYINSHFYKNSRTQAFDVDARLESAEFSSFNPILNPLTSLSFTSGQCSGMRLSMQGNDYDCKGDLDIAYEDLKMDLSVFSKNKDGVFADIRDWAGNTILLNNSNSMDASNGDIYSKRDPQRGFVRYWWKSMESGLMDAALVVEPSFFKK